MATTTTTATAVTATTVQGLIYNKGPVYTGTGASNNAQPPKGMVAPYAPTIKNNKVTWQLLSALLAAGTITQATARNIAKAQPNAHGCYVAYAIRNGWCAKAAPTKNVKYATAAQLAKALNGAGFSQVATPAGVQLWHSSMAAPKQV